MKRWCLLLLLPLLFLFLAVNVFAEEGDSLPYTEKRDPYTGEVVKDGSSGIDGAESNMIKLSENRYFDSGRGSFAFVIPEAGNRIIYSTAAYGMITNNPVSVELPAGTNAVLYRNGTPVDSPDFRYIADRGAYVLEIMGNSPDACQPLSFTIVGSIEGSLESYRMPDGFSVDTVSRDGEEIRSPSYEVDFTEEGKYAVRYTCDAADIACTLNIVIDHTPPVLALANVKNGIAAGPVDISDAEPGSTISVRLEGKSIPYTKVLTQTGTYRITLRDPAGNTSEYSFRIRLYFNVTSYAFFAAVLLAVGILAAYLIISRKKLRVR